MRPLVSLRARQIVSIYCLFSFLLFLQFSKFLLGHQRPPKSKSSGWKIKHKNNQDFITFRIHMFLPWKNIAQKIDIETFFLYSYSFRIPILFNPSFFLVACWHLLLEIDTRIQISWYTLSCFQRHLAGNLALSWAITLFTSIPKYIYILPLLGYKFLAFLFMIAYILYLSLNLSSWHYLTPILTLSTLQKVILFICVS